MFQSQHINNSEVIGGKMFEKQRAALKEKLVGFQERMDGNSNRAMTIAHKIVKDNEPDKEKEAAFAKAVLGDNYSIQNQEENNKTID